MRKVESVQTVVGQLEQKARKIRRLILCMLEKAGSGHTGGSLSAVEILTVLYFHHLRHRPTDPHWEERDRFILSKGHSAPVLYAVLAESGYFPLSWLEHLREIGHPLQGHPCMNKTPGLEASTGSLGQGLSIGCGMAWAARRGGTAGRVYVLLGDGECDEGQVWEAAMFARHYRLDNLTALVDRNALQVDGATEKVMSLEPFADKWRAFGWEVLEVDGHDIEALMSALQRANAVKGTPTVIIAHTVKGKGISFMEGRVEWHGRAPDRDQLAAALRELGSPDEGSSDG